ncbi:hypothetical protein ES703_39527 [subsurface metagenome]
MSIVRGFFSGVLGFLLIITLLLLGIVITINATILNPPFVLNQMDKLDVYSLATDRIKAEVKNQLALEEPYMTYLTQVVDKTAADLQPWLRDQTSEVVGEVYAYLKDGRELDVSISLEPVRASIKQNLGETVQESPLPEGIPQSIVDAYLIQVYAEIDQQVPASFELNKSSLEPEAIVQMEQAREVIGYVGPGFKILTGLAILLALAIALLHWWRPKPITLSIGIALAISGLLSYLGTITASNLARQATLPPMIAELQASLPQLASDITQPLQTYGIWLLAGGAVLIVVSVVLAVAVKPSGGD